MLTAADGCGVKLFAVCCVERRALCVAVRWPGKLKNGDLDAQLITDKQMQLLSYLYPSTTYLDTCGLHSLL